MSILLQLIFEFFKTGLFAVGGGLATLPFLYEMSTKTGWFTHADIADMIAISESTPGAIGINMATYAGYKTAGIPGGICATIGLALPSLIIIIIIARFLDHFSDNKYVKRAFYGLRPASIAMITAALVNVVKVALLNIPAWEASGSFADLIRPVPILMAVILFFVMKKLKWHPVLFLDPCLLERASNRFAVLLPSDLPAFLPSGNTSLCLKGYARGIASPRPGTAAFSSLIPQNHPAQSLQSIS